jgi:C1A family cysteine protease
MRFSFASLLFLFSPKELLMNIHANSELAQNSTEKLKIINILLLPALILLVFIFMGSGLGTPASRVNRVGASPAMLSNPAAVYCQDMGYAYETIKQAGGEIGVCHLPEEKTCGAWEFLEGSCGQEYSYCAKQGYQIKTKNDGKNPYSQTYGVCVSDQGKEIGSVVELSNLPEKSLGCQGNLPDLSTKQELELGPAYSPPDTLPPTSFNWRTDGPGPDDFNIMTPVRDQGSCGSCWAFSAVGVAEAVHNMEAGVPHPDLDLSEQYLVSDCHSARGYQTCCGGWKDIALEYMRDYGVPDESCMSYVDWDTCTCGGDTCDSNCTYRTGGDCSDRTCADRCGDWASRLVHITDLGSVVDDPTTIKQALVDNGPLAVSIDMGGEFTGGIFHCPSHVSGYTNHAVSIVGYNDSGGYWLARNSWGSTWNGNGYFKVGYGECSIEEYVYYVEDDPAVTTPANDDMSGAIDIIPISLPFTNTQSTEGATLEEGEPYPWCAEGIASVWYKFTPIIAGLYEVDTLGSTYDTVLNVYEDMGGGVYNPNSCNDDDIGLTSRTVFYGASGTTYYIGVTEYGSLNLGSDGGENDPSKDRNSLEPEKAVGGNLTINMDSYSCPAGSICATVSDHWGYPLENPSFHVYDGSVKVDETYSEMGGYVESNTLLAGTYDVDIVGYATFITETGWSLGYNSASAVSLPAVVIYAYDIAGNPTLRADITIRKGGTIEFIGNVIEANPQTVYVTPGTYDLFVDDYWDMDHVFLLEDQTVGGGGGTITLSALAMGYDTITFDWDGVSFGLGITPFFDDSGDRAGIGWLSDGHVLYASMPDSSYLMGGTLIDTGATGNWYYQFMDGCPVTGSPGQTVTCTFGGALSTSLATVGEPFYPGDTGGLLATIEDTYGNVITHIGYEDYLAVPLSGSSEDKDKTADIHTDPNTGQKIVVHDIEDRIVRTQPDGADQYAYTSYQPSYMVWDPLVTLIPGSYTDLSFNAVYEFDIPNPANLGTWVGEVGALFGTFPYDKYYDSIFFDVLAIDKIGLYDPALSKWFLKPENVGGAAGVNRFLYGPAGGGRIPITGDWDGDGVDTVGLYDPVTSRWFLKPENVDGGAGVIKFYYGPAGGGRLPIVGDWDGDGTDTVGLYDPVTSRWFLKPDNVDGGAGVIKFYYGPAGGGRLPISGDWDGDGEDTVGLYDPATSRWFLKPENVDGGAGVTKFYYGPAGGGRLPIVGDWDGDGVDTVGLYDPVISRWFLKPENVDGGAGVIKFYYGPAGGGRLPIAGNW